jgi:hypothetical protein
MALPQKAAEMLLPNGVIGQEIVYDRTSDPSITQKKKKQTTTTPIISNQCKYCNYVTFYNALFC